MTHLEERLGNLKYAVIDMMERVEKQLLKAKEAFLTMDIELAQEIIHSEKRINALELTIDRDCEKIFALINPLASDLRFVIAVLKINSDLERIADYAEGIAHYVIEMEKPLEEKHISKLQIAKMFDISISMLNDMALSFEEENTKKARKIFKKDADLNKINRNSSKIISDFTKDSNENTKTVLFTFSIIRKLERVGDHVKNIAEQTIFYLEAKVLKHKGKK